MLTRFPDKPLTSSPAIFDSLVDGEWLAEFKFDGWRCVIEVGRFNDGADWKFTSRQNRPLPVSLAVRRDLARQLAAGPMQMLPPVGTLFDAEWMARRAGNAQGEERIWLFDVLRVGTAVWRFGAAAMERFDALLLAAPAPLVVPHTTTGYRAFFESSKLDPRTEGIVLKRCDSLYIGSTRDCADNPQWVKVKWRDGAAGTKQIA